MREFVFGTFAYEYQLVRQDRKTLSLTVRPDLSIVLKCPVKTETEKIQTFLQKKWFWLEKQLSYFKKYQRKVYEKEYISGEGYLYLGRQYKLMVKKGKEDKVSTVRGQLIVYTTKLVSNTKHNKKLIETWFADKTVSVFESRLNEMLYMFDYDIKPELSIREMQKRWGSFLNKKKILLNPKLIHTSKDCIDYVIVHELCHFKYKDHSKKFWKFLDEKYPRWEKVKDKLETLGSFL